MVSALQITCLAMVLGLSHGWMFPSFFESNSPSNATGIGSIFEEMNQRMMSMQHHFERFFKQSLFTNHHDVAFNDEQRQLETVTPNCTTSTPSTMERNKRKRFRPTQTITCVKHLIIDGKQHILKETNVTDETGHLISRSKIYQSSLIHQSNSTVATSTNNPELVVY
jgi:hypothetical protein